MLLLLLLFRIILWCHFTAIIIIGGYPSVPLWRGRTIIGEPSTHTGTIIVGGYHIGADQLGQHAIIEAAFDKPLL